MLIYDPWWVMASAMKLLNLDFVLETRTNLASHD